MLRKINKICSNRYVIVLITCNFLFISCNKDSNITGSPTVSQRSMQKGLNAIKGNFTTEDYVKGIFFMSGPVVDLIPQLAELRWENILTDQVLINYIRAQEDQIISILREKHPDLLDQFKQEITSKDQVRIKTAMDNLSAVLMPIITDFYNLNDAETKENIESTIAGLRATEGFDEGDIKNSKAAINDFVKKQKESLPAQGSASDRAAAVPGEGQCSVLVIPLAVVFVIVLVWEFAVGGTTPASRAINTEGLFKDNLINTIAVEL